MENGKIFLDKRNKTTYVRKRLWNKDLGKYDQSTILKFANYEQPPQELPGDVIKEHNLTKSEINQYSELAKSLIDERNAVTKRVTLSLLKQNLVDAINATKTVEDVERLGVESLDELADLTNE
ncbi:hypothetical protein, partial [Vibrio sp. 1569]|uniref:hypothetical protein n=1 Tax=Vibrio sp. 1569 TaxID=3074565 RepID=UPI0029648D54